MKYICTNCNYIYDEDLGDKSENIIYGTKFESLGENFYCPTCGETKDFFYELKEEINYIGDFPRDNIEKLHFINIKELSEKQIEITVGYKNKHSNSLEHRITSIGLYDEYGDLIYENFFGPNDKAYLVYDISDFDEYEIRIKCNIHGTWAKKCKKN